MIFAIIMDPFGLHPLKIDGVFEYRGIRFYEREGLHYVTLGKDLYTREGNKTFRALPGHYRVVSSGHYHETDIYVYADDEGYGKYRLFDGSDLIISDSGKASIVSSDPFVKGHYCYLKGNTVSSDVRFYVNGKPCQNACLEEWDCVEFFSHRFIYTEDLIYVNSRFIKVNYLTDSHKEQLIRYSPVQISPFIYLPDNERELELPELEDFVPVKDGRNGELLKSLLPGIIMSLSVMSISLLNYYNAMKSGKDLLGRISYLIIPGAMLLSSVVVPVMFQLIERSRYKRKVLENRKEYLQKIEEFEEKLQQEIDGYVKSCQSSFFDAGQIQERMFYAHKGSADHLRLSLGTVSRAIDLRLKTTGDPAIDNKLRQLESGHRLIEGLPLFLELRNNFIVTLIVGTHSKHSLFLTLLAELAFKHHPDDLHIAIYSHDPDVISTFYNLPHMFKGGRRLYFDSFRNLQELDQQSLDRPLVLFLYDECRFRPSNPQIRVIRMSCGRSDIRRDSQMVVEYRNDHGYLYQNGKIRFSYFGRQIDFARNFAYLGRSCIRKRDRGRFSFSTLYGDRDIAEGYLQHDRGLQADFIYDDDELLQFDLHEDRQGPHGLIGGSTGSGKSEFIISLLLSLCLRYPPDHLNIVLIDYKGGGIRESLTVQGKTVPHIIASISNLENNAFERLIVALNNECVRRQVLFKQLSRARGSSIMDLDDYLDECEKDDRISHLLVVVDEFAELKKNNPQLIKELISISRIGRSLGLHLILATQKPSGSIDEEIWSNSRFKISLKVYEEKDSQDIIRCKDAAYLDRPGSFYLKVDDSLLKGQCLYAKRVLNGQDPYEVCLLDESLQVSKKHKIFHGEQVMESFYYCQKIMEACETLDLSAKPLPFEPPLPVAWQDLPRNGKLLLGTRDDYFRGDHSLLEHPIDVSLLVMTDEKKRFATLLDQLNSVNRKMIVICGERYEGGHICDCLDYSDGADIEFLFEYLPLGQEALTIVIDDLDCLLSYDERYVEYLLKILKRGNRNKVCLICFTSGRQLGYRIIRAFPYKAIIGSSDVNDQLLLFDQRSRYLGNSFYLEEEPISFVPIRNSPFIMRPLEVEHLIPEIPEVLSPETGESSCLIGYDLKKRCKVFAPEGILICSFDESLLDVYRKAYGSRFEYAAYDRRFKDLRSRELLWLGPGVFQQHLFHHAGLNDLGDGQGIYVQEGRKTILRTLDHA